MRKLFLLAAIILTTIFSACATVTEEPAAPNEQEDEIVVPVEQGDESAIQTYTNEELKYTFNYVSGWNVDTSGLTNSVAKVVTAYPKELRPTKPGDPTYFDIHLDDRELSYLLGDVFGGSSAFGPRSDVDFGGQKAYQFISTADENEVWIVVPYGDLIYVITSTKVSMDEVQIITNSFRFL